MARVIEVDVDWVEVQREVRHTLRCRRVRADRADELTQAALERAVASARPAWRTVDAVRWSVRVALNLEVDDRRRQSAIPVGDELPDVVRDDVARQAIARYDLGRVADALPQLRPEDVSALLDVGADADDRERRRLKVARFRARAKLRRLVDGAGAWLIGSPRRMLAADLPLRDALAATVAAALITMPGTWELGGAHPGQLAPVVPVRTVAGMQRLAPVIEPVPAPELVQAPTAPESVDSVDDGGRPDWVDPDDGVRVADVPAPNRDGDYLWYWTDDEERDDEPVSCVWHRSTSTEVCTPMTWGDAREVSPVPLPGTPA